MSDDARKQALFDASHAAEDTFLGAALAEAAFTAAAEDAARAEDAAEAAAEAAARAEAVAARVHAEATRAHAEATRVREAATRVREAAARALTLAIWSAFEAWAEYEDAADSSKPRGSE